MKPTALAAAVGAMTLGALVVAGPADADVLNPRDPDYCGNAPDILFCTEHRSTYPNVGEATFLTDIRGRIGGNDAAHLAAGRAACLELPSRPAGDVIREVGNYLHVPMGDAGQVVAAANANICPKVQPQS